MQSLMDIGNVLLYQKLVFLFLLLFAYSQFSASDTDVQLYNNTNMQMQRNNSMEDIGRYGRYNIFFFTLIIIDMKIM